MWCPPRESIAVCDSGTSFAALRWHELFSSHTPDIFHPSLFNLPGLLKEAQFIGEQISRHAAWQKHMQLVREEVAERSTSLESSCLSPRHRKMLSSIGSEQTGHSEATNLTRLLLLEGIDDQIESFIAEKAAQIDLAGCEKKKTDCDTILSLAATVAYRRGGVSLGDTALQQALKEGAPRVQKLLDLREHFVSGEFECIVGVQGVNDVQLTELRKVVDHGEPARSDRIYKAGTHIHGLPPQAELAEHQRSGWLCCKVNAGNATEAVEQLRERVRNALNVMALFNQCPASSLHPGGWIIQNGNAIAVSSRDETLKNHHARAQALKLSDLAMKSLSGVSEPAIFAALDLHNAALSTSDHRFRLVNLWSALECLTAVLEGDTIINRVLRAAPPLLAWRNIDKYIRYLSISLHLWIKSNPDLNTGDLPFLLGYNQKVPPEQLLKVLTLPDGSPALKQLSSFAGGHPLLVFRMFKAWKQFSSPKSVKRRMAQSETRLRWHLYRIYRARNLLVHDGIAAECLPQLADHLQHYVSWLIGRMIQALGLGSNWKLRDAWHYWLNKADYVRTSLPERDNDHPHFELRMEDVFTARLNDPTMNIWQAPTP